MATKPVTLTIRQVEFNISSAFEKPAFAFLDWGHFEAAIYAAFQPSGLKLGDIKVESTTLHPGDFSIAAWLLGLGALARFRLDRVELWSNSLLVMRDPALVGGLVTQAHEVLRSTSPETVVDSHSTSLAVHGTPSGVAAGAVIERFASAVPEGQPPFQPSGVSFQCAWPADEGRGSVVLERSVAVADGLFVRVSAEFRGILGPEEALSRAEGFWKQGLARLGLEPRWDG